MNFFLFKISLIVSVVIVGWLWDGMDMFVFVVDFLRGYVAFEGPIYPCCGLLFILSCDIELCICLLLYLKRN